MSIKIFPVTCIRVPVCDLLHNVMSWPTVKLDVVLTPILPTYRGTFIKSMPSWV